MLVTIDIKRCQGCRLCKTVNPDIFYAGRQNQQMTVLKQPGSVMEEINVKVAALYCPNDAIGYVQDFNDCAN